MKHQTYVLPMSVKVIFTVVIVTNVLTTIFIMMQYYK
jgi:hypothetical protein